MEGDNPRRYVPSRSELASPTTDWELCWRLSRLPGLGSDLVSFNFKLLHLLLVTRQRLQQFNVNHVATCCLCEDEVDEDLEHACIHCNFNNGVGQALVRVVNEH